MTDENENGDGNFPFSFFVLIAAMGIRDENENIFNLFKLKFFQRN
jgi:hypothetical protein